MSFEESMRNNRSTDKGTRIILRFAGLQDGPTLSTENAKILWKKLQVRRDPLNPEVTFSANTANIFVDTAVPTADQDAALVYAVERTDSALTATLVPADLEEARISEYTPGLKMSHALYLMQRDTGTDTDVTERAKEIMLDHRNTTICGAYNRLFYEV